MIRAISTAGSGQGHRSGRRKRKQRAQEEKDNQQFHCQQINNSLLISHLYGETNVVPCSFLKLISSKTSTQKGRLSFSIDGTLIDDYIDDTPATRPCLRFFKWFHRYGRRMVGDFDTAGRCGEEDALSWHNLPTLETWWALGLPFEGNL